MAGDPKDPPSSELTPESVYLRRREFMKNAAAFAGVTAAFGGGLLLLSRRGSADLDGAPQAAKAEDGGVPEDALEIASRPPEFRVSEELTSFEAVSTYNNFYEFGLDKSDPARHAHSLRPKPWT